MCRATKVEAEFEPSMFDSRAQAFNHYKPFASIQPQNVILEVKNEGIHVEHILSAWPAPPTFIFRMTMELVLSSYSFY